MNFKKISIILAREFMVRVRKKSFIVATLLTPIMMVLLIAIPSVMMTMNEGGGPKTVMVIDPSEVSKDVLKDTDRFHYRWAPPTATLESFKAQFEDLGLYAVCVVTPLEAERSFDVKLYSYKQVNMDFQVSIGNRFEEAAEREKLKAYGITDLDKIMEEINTNIEVKTMVWDEVGEEKEKLSFIPMIASYLLSFLIYIFIFMYGSMIIRSVIEEKTTRVVEVMISSVKPVELMLGKIFGVALVAILQFVIWIVLGAILGGVAIGLLGVDPSSMAQGASIGAGGADLSQAAMTTEAEVLIQNITGLPIFTILISFLVFFALGYLLYASMFAAIGSVSDTETETQQFQLPVTLPLILGLFVMMHTFQYPESQISFWFSMIPFTSPMVMLARVPFGVPTWELCLSIFLLLLTFFAIVRFSAKIYRVGILMYGKKVTWKEIWKWSRYKN